MADPQVLARPEQPYVGIRRTVTMDTIRSIADRIPVLIGWLGQRGIAPAGAPFLRYRVIDMERELDIEAGVPVAEPVDGEGEVSPGTLPAGRYATATHVGPYDGLVDATAALLTWADDQGLEFDVRDSPAGDVWGCRLEIFNTNPVEEPDPARQETVLAFRLAD
jgi:effector-binding domain-containing protein